ncbi:uncharacterized protein LOC117100479 [Anneissia japonica]|uniref:uncharacterized protein LOC117100479 n=1 Tax=Anneissia japonica TaxID=1529436 RepID=UPI0014255C55|nr:uncharacterized protein LOC117100479 [Anneissia japonica]
MHFYAYVVALCCVVCSSQKQRCCLNHDMYTFSGEIVFGAPDDQHLYITKYTFMTVMDFVQLRFFYNITRSEEGNITKYMYIDDFKQNITWTNNFETQVCEKEPMSNGSEPEGKACIPDYAQYIGQFNNPGDVLVNRWKFEYDYETDGKIGEEQGDTTVNRCELTGDLYLHLFSILRPKPESFPNSSIFEILLLMKSH